MNRLNPNRIVLFLCIVAAITVTIFGVKKHFADQRSKAAAELAEQARKAAAIAEAQARQAAETLQAEANRKAAKASLKAAEAKAAETARINSERALREAAEARERFRTTYVNTNIAKQAGIQMVAVAVISETGTMNHNMGAALVKHFQREGVKLTDSFFKPEMATDGLFATALNGSSDLFTRLELAKSLDAVLLARQQVQYETNSELNNIVTAVMQLEIVTLPVAGKGESQSWTLSANGAGIRRADARALAEERIVKQIDKATSMSLNLNP